MSPSRQMRHTPWILTLLTLLFISVKVQAQISLEPWLGFENGDMQIGNTEYSAKGLRYGIKLGAKVVEPLSLGVSYSLGSVEVDRSPAEDLELTQTGLYGSLSAGAARVWFEYMFNIDGEYDQSGNIDGTGTKIGFGYFASSDLSLNIEKSSCDFEQSNGNQSSELDTYIFSVGFVF